MVSPSESSPQTKMGSECSSLGMLVCVSDCGMWESVLCPHVYMLCAFLYALFFSLMRDWAPSVQGCVCVCVWVGAGSVSGLASCFFQPSTRISVSHAEYLNPMRVYYAG